MRLLRSPSPASTSSSASKTSLILALEDESARWLAGSKVREPFLAAAAALRSCCSFLIVAKSASDIVALRCRVGYIKRGPFVRRGGWTDRDRWEMAGERDGGRCFRLALELMTVGPRNYFSPQGWGPAAGKFGRWRVPASSYVIHAAG